MRIQVQGKVIFLGFSPELQIYTTHSPYYSSLHLVVIGVGKLSAAVHVTSTLQQYRHCEAPDNTNKSLSVGHSTLLTYMLLHPQ
jgi:hypothetical protein